LQTAAYDCSDFYNPSAMIDHYIPETSTLVKTVTGAKKAFVISCSTRNKDANQTLKAVKEMAANPSPELEIRAVEVDKERIEFAELVIIDARKEHSHKDPAKWCIWISRPTAQNRSYGIAHRQRLLQKRNIFSKLTTERYLLASFTRDGNMRYIVFGGRSRTSREIRLCSVIRIVLMRRGILWTFFY
jgi:hypothetical protein